MILVTYRHGLRASEVCDLRWDDIDFGASAIHVARKKNGVSTTQQLNGQELRALRRLQRAQKPKSTYVFVTERGGPFDRTSFNFMVKRTGRKAALPFQVHAHMLRHAAGYALVNAGVWREINKYVSAYASAGNILNQHYNEVVGYPAITANIRAGLRLTFGGER